MKRLAKDTRKRKNKHLPLHTPLCGQFQCLSSKFVITYVIFTINPSLVPDRSCSTTYSAKVRVGFLRVQAAVVLDVLEGLVHQASVAALVALWPGAVHEVLLAEGH